MFTTQETFKRNKHYFDALKISELEHSDAKKRRKPKQYHRYQEDKVEKAFQSAKK